MIMMVLASRPTALVFILHKGCSFCAGFQTLDLTKNKIRCKVTWLTDTAVSCIQHESSSCS